MTDPQIIPVATTSAHANDELANDQLVDDAQAAVMKQKMQDDVAAWAASRADVPSPPLVASRPAARQSAPIDPAKPDGPRGAKPAAKSTAPVPVALAPAATSVQPRKPFSMNYDGRPAGKYAAERFERGAR